MVSVRFLPLPVRSHRLRRLYVQAVARVPLRLALLQRFRVFPALRRLLLRLVVAPVPVAAAKRGEKQKGTLTWSFGTHERWLNAGRDGRVRNEWGRATEVAHRRSRFITG